MSLTGKRIATVGSGVMAEAMIAGLLRGKQVSPEQIVASHPRQDRRNELVSSYGIGTVEDNAAAVSNADVVVLAIKPQMLVRVGRELRGSLKDGPAPHQHHRRSDDACPGQRAWASRDRTQHAQHTRSARPRHDRLVCHSSCHREPARSSAGCCLAASASSSRSTTRSSSRWRPPSVGTGPTYVFLVMEALIDAAVHLGFPRHIAHDLVIETLEGSTLFAKSSGMHPAQLRNMVTSPGGTSAAALHELESGRLRTVLSEAVWAAYRRTEELGRSLEADTAEIAPD